MSAEEFNRSMIIAKEHQNEKRNFGRHVIEGKEVFLGCRHCKQGKIKILRGPFNVDKKTYGWECKTCSKPINAVLVFKK